MLRQKVATPTGVRHGLQQRAAAPPRQARMRVVAQASAATLVFRMRHHVEFGQQLCLVGASDTVGNWDPNAALAMNWSDGDVWTAEAPVAVGTKLEYKFIIKQGSSVTWQQGQNKGLTVPEAATVEVWDSWGPGPTSVKVLEAAEAVSAVPEPTAEAAAEVVPTFEPAGVSAPLEVASAVPEIPAVSQRIEAAQVVARSFDQDKAADIHVVSTVENLEAEAMLDYEEADKYEVLEVSNTTNGNGATAVQTAAVKGLKVGPSAYDHLSLNELRSELKKRGLPASGNRRQLINKLQDSGVL